MTLPEIASRDEWRKARVALLADEKAMTKARDALSTKRRTLPMVRIEKDYRFDGPEGSVSLLDIFDGHRQLIIQHFMFDPSWEDGCPSCTAGADELSAGLLRHLEARDTAFAVVSRAPLEKLERYKKKRGWDFRWYSSFGSDFNYDFHVSLDPSVAQVEYNFRGPDELKAHGAEWIGLARRLCRQCGPYRSGSGKRCLAWAFRQPSGRHRCRPASAALPMALWLG